MAHPRAALASRQRDTCIAQVMSRKGNRMDGGGTNQAFGNLRDEFFKGRDRNAREKLKTDLEVYVRHWDHVRFREKLKDLTPVEFQEQALREAV